MTSRSLSAHGGRDVRCRQRRRERYRGGDRGDGAAFRTVDDTGQQRDLRRPGSGRQSASTGSTTTPSTKHHAHRARRARVWACRYAIPEMRRSRQRLDTSTSRPAPPNPRCRSARRLPRPRDEQSRWTRQLAVATAAQLRVNAIIVGFINTGTPVMEAILADPVVVRPSSATSWCRGWQAGDRCRRRVPGLRRIGLRDRHRADHRRWRPLPSGVARIGLRGAGAGRVGCAAAVHPTGDFDDHINADAHRGPPAHRLRSYDPPPAAARTTTSTWPPKR